jgi:hypothetical protein
LSSGQPYPVDNFIQYFEQPGPVWQTGKGIDPLFAHALFALPLLKQSRPKMKNIFNSNCWETKKQNKQKQQELSTQMGPVWQTGKGIDPLFEYNCLCLHVNPIVGHLNSLMYIWKRSQSLID